MNLYLILRTGLTNWEEYYGAVVTAESEEAARDICPDGDLSDGNNTLRGWIPSNEVMVKLIGTAVPGIKRGVVLSSFNAG